VARKGRGRLWPVFVGLFAVAGLLQAFALSAMMLARLVEASEAAAESPFDQVPIRPYLYSVITRTESELHDIEASVRSAQDKQSRREQALNRLRSRLRPGVQEPESRRDYWMSVFESRGSAGFVPRESLFWVSAEDWPEGEAEDSLLRALALLSTLLFVTVLLFNLGAAHQDRGKVEWGLEWLFTMPVSRRSLLLARIGEFALVNPFW